LKACGLEATFTPNVVLESLGKDKDGNVVSVMTGRDGRFLWSGQTKLVRYPDVTRKFSYPWNSISKIEKRKSARFSYIIRIISESSLSLKAVRPLVRLALQFWQLDMNAFVRIGHKILSCTPTVVCRRSSAARALRIKPTLLESEKPLNRFGLESVPLWDRRRKPPWHSRASGGD
jgi:hypothetical protein